MKDRCFEGQNSFGPFYLYAVDHAGEQKAFFATPEVHQQIVDHGLKAGDEILVRKVAVQNGKKMGAKMELEVLKKVEPLAIGPGGANRNVPVAGDGLKALMEQCVREAVEITRGTSGVAWQNEDIRAIAASLFIARSRAG